MKCDMGIALNLLMGRYTRQGKNDWPINGTTAIFNSRRLPRNIEGAVRRLMTDFDKANPFVPIKMIRVVDNDVWFLQRTLEWKHVDWLFKKAFRWQKWKRAALPIFVRYKGKWICWNGTHRTILCMLTNRRLRCRMIDLDAFIVWLKENKDKRKWNCRVLNFG